MTDTARWLDARRPVMPDSLREAIDAALREERPGSLAERMADAGLAALGRVACEESDRSRAVALLAADALLTYALEAAAEEGPTAVERLASTLDPPRFTALLKEAGE